jgi:hypothetical protein
MTGSEWDSISITAHYTAQVWARQHLPWAWHFDTLKGRIFYSAVQPLCLLASRFGITAPPDFLVQRHRIIDALVERLAPAQLIELAGGLSPRGLACSQRHGLHAIDVDLEAVVRLKASLVEKVAPPGYHLRALDLIASQDYARDLEPALQQVRPTVVITEGILPYFSIDQQRHVFSCIAGLLHSCGGGTYLTDIHHQDEVDRLPLGLARIFRWGLHQISRSPRNPMIPNFELGERLLLEAGFHRVRAHRPSDWEQELDLPHRELGSGLHVYESTVE